jgi:hypothetical protein
MPAPETPTRFYSGVAAVPALLIGDDALRRRSYPRLRSRLSPLQRQILLRRLLDRGYFYL